MSPYRVFIDTFSGALGDLPKKHHGDREKVLEVLRAHPRFTVWDIDTSKLAGTMDDLKRDGHLVYKQDDGGYPWCEVTVIDNPPPRLVRPIACTKCGARQPDSEKWKRCGCGSRSFQLLAPVVSGAGDQESGQ